MMKEYVVTLKNFEDLDLFYEDMETPGGSITIPDRMVDCAIRRNISRNTHYLLTEEEAQLLRDDPRVLAVELLPSELGLVVTPYWTQTAPFQKNSTISSSDKNWGLLRCTLASQISGWGTSSQTATISTTASGKNVDVVIVDAHVNPNHPEFAVNVDGTGGSRVQQIDWFQYNTVLGLSYTGAYSYSSFSSNHGTHVAGTVAGNTQGWARNSKIYNIEFSYTGANAPGGSWELLLFDYLRAFHKNKSINPSTGRRNPTITNHSWGYSYNDVDLSQVTSVTYQGTTTSLSGLATSIKAATLQSNGVPVPAGTYLYKIPARYTALDADIQDAIADGVIVISSAGNSYWNCTTSTGVDYNNYINTNNYGVLYHSRGSSPSAADGVICVGSIGTASTENKSNFSNWGTRIDIWAPGSSIISSVYDSTAATEFSITLVNDPRNSSYKLGSISGTSMSSPQVSGIAALIAESCPQMKQSEMKNLLTKTSKSNQIPTGSNPNASPYTGIGNSNNKYLFYRLLRGFNGEVYPRKNQNGRGSQGQMFPRVKTKYTK